TSHDTLYATPIQLLSITLNRKTLCNNNNIPSTELPPLGTPVPPNYHLVYFLPKDYENELALDGYKTRYSPPPSILKTSFTKRMWAGGELLFNPQNPLLIGQKVQMTTKIRDVKYKISSNNQNNNHHNRDEMNEKVFVWLEKEISNEFGWSLKDTRCLVYMKPQDSNSKLPPRKIIKSNKESEFKKIIYPSEILLFRFSALTFNSHRIHYDHEYSTKVEGYPDTTDISYEAWAENKEGGIAMKGTAISSKLMPFSCRPNNHVDSDKPTKKQKSGISYKTKSVKLKDPRNYQVIQGFFLPIHKEAPSIYYKNVYAANDIVDPLPENIEINNDLLVGNFTIEDHC
ncbi:2711_t:CDS:2, partial [Diversispora eburnea]